MNKYNIDTLVGIQNLELDYIVDHHNVTINMLITYSNHSFFFFAKKVIRSLLNLSLTIWYLVKLQVMINTHHDEN